MIMKFSQTLLGWLKGNPHQEDSTSISVMLSLVFTRSKWLIWVKTVRGVDANSDRIHMIRMFLRAILFMWFDSEGDNADWTLEFMGVTQIALNLSTVRMTKVRTDAQAVVSGIRLLRRHADCPRPHGYYHQGSYLLRVSHLTRDHVVVVVVIDDQISWWGADVLGGWTIDGQEEMWDKSEKGNQKKETEEKIGK